MAYSVVMLLLQIRLFMPPTTLPCSSQTITPSHVGSSTPRCVTIKLDCTWVWLRPSVVVPRLGGPLRLCSMSLFFDCSSDFLHDTGWIRLDTFELRFAASFPYEPRNFHACFPRSIPLRCVPVSLSVPCLHPAVYV